MRMTSGYVRDAARQSAIGALARRIGRAVACIGIAGVVACNADAEIFKCTSADGRILYSDAPCPANSRGEVVVPNDNSPMPAPKSPPPDSPAPAPKSPPPGSGASPSSPAMPDAQPPVPRSAGRYELSVNERQRVANLEQVQRAADNDEKREAARIEIQEIRRGTLARMSYEDQRRKDGYWVDLGNLDRKRRLAAVRQLSDLFASYQ